MPKTSSKITVRAQVRALAHQHNVTYKAGPRDGFARTMSNLAGNSVQLDSTGKLIVALQRAGVISRDVAVVLQAQYMRQLLS